MARAIICKGDPTSHGGQVLEGSADATIDGRPIALRGHLIYCPLCKGKFPISEGLDFHTFGGLGTAVEGMKTGCGAIEPVRFFVCRGREIIPKGMFHDRSNDHEKT